MSILFNKLEKTPSVTSTMMYKLKMINKICIPPLWGTWYINAGCMYRPEFCGEDGVKRAIENHNYYTIHETDVTNYEYTFIKKENSEETIVGCFVYDINNSNMGKTGYIYTINLSSELTCSNREVANGVMLFLEKQHSDIKQWDIDITRQFDHHNDTYDFFTDKRRGYKHTYNTTQHVAHLTKEL